MGKEFLGVRINSGLHRKLTETSDDTGETLTDITERALAEYLQHDVVKVDVHTLDKRLKALERKFEGLSNAGAKVKPKPKGKTPKSVDPDALGELITIEQISDLTGYALSTLGSKLSRVGITVKDRVNGNRGGLYSKQEVIEGIGYK